jgi:hypothetical protein
MSSDPHWLEMAFWTSQICLTLVAALTAWFAYHQLVALKRNSDQELRISHSNLILSFDHRFANDLFEARSAFKKAQDEIKNLILTQCPRAGDLEKDTKTREQWGKKLAEMRDKNQEDYLKLMSVCFFFETVGMMVKLEYIDKAAIFGLFKGTILAVDNCFREHIDQRQKEAGVPTGYLENVIFLCDLCKAEAR